MNKKKKLQRLYMKIIIYLKRKFKEEKTKFPKKFEKSEKTASLIFLKLLKSEETELYSNMKVFESYLISEKYNIYIFLEKNNMKVINSVYGYDIYLSNQMEQYLTERFLLEIYKRRQKFKHEALDKIQFSLDKTLSKIQLRDN